MLAPSWKVSRDIRCTRLRRGLSQHQLAARAGFRQPYLAQIEKGVRAISRRFAPILEAILQVKPGRFSKGLIGRGRQPLTSNTRAALRQLRRGLRKFWSASHVNQPKYPQPHRVMRSDDPLWPMAIHLGECAAKEVKQLELLRGQDNRFWRNFNSLRFDSWSEKRLLVRLGLLPCELTCVRLRQLGCSLNVVDWQTGQAAGPQLGFVLKGQRASVVWCPQVAVRTASGTVLCPDNLLVISAGGKQVTAVVEVDGGPFHGDLPQQRWRDNELGVPILHIDASRVGEPGILREILSWAADLVR